MSSPSVVVIDALNSLLEAEANSIFHFVGPGSPYLEQAGPEVRQPLEMMSKHLDHHAEELKDLILSLGGTPAIPPAPDAEDQYLSYLSLKFLLPKLVDAKELMIRRYQSVIHAVKTDPNVVQVLQRQLNDIRADMAILKQTAALVAAGR